MQPSSKGEGNTIHVAFVWTKAYSRKIHYTNENITNAQFYIYLNDIRSSYFVTYTVFLYFCFIQYFPKAGKGQRK